MTSQGRRASTLLTVLLCVVALGLLTMGMASSLLSHYNLAVRYRDTTQADWLARAGLQEFIRQAEEMQAGADVTAIPEPLLPKFLGREVLLRPTAHLPGTVTLLLDGDHPSRDNTLSPLAAQSSYDPSGKASIPPYSLDLVLRVEWARRVFHYQALVQQRWPYALAAPAPIRILGSFNDPGAPDTGLGSGSYAEASVKGKILVMKQGAYSESPTHPWPTPLELPNDLYGLLYSFKGNSALGGLTLGRGFDLYYMRASLNQGTPNPDFVPVQRVESSAQASIEGGVHLYQNGLDSNDPIPVDIAPSCSQRGPIRANYRLRGLNPVAESTRRQMRKLWEWPVQDEASWPDVTDQFPLRDFSFTQEGPPRFQGPIIFTSHPERPYPAGAKVVPLLTGRGRLQRSVDAWVDNLNARPDAIVPMAEMWLDDCSLLVSGDCRLRPVTRSNGTRSNPKLVGSRATLLVRGTLCLDEAELDAGSNGMVIFSKNFFIKAEGNYNGLIVAQEGGAFFGGIAPSPGQGPRLNIRGGVLIGNNQLKVNTLLPYLHDNITGVVSFPTVELSTLVLASTRIEYAPEYLRGLNQFGGFHLSAMMRR